MVSRPGVMAAALVATLVVAAPAEAAKWRGKTRQGRGASVHTGPDGLVSYVRIRYLAPCRDNTAVTAGVKFVPTLDHSTPTSFADSGPFTFRIGKERIRARTFVNGGLRRSGRWTGNFGIRLRVFRDGRLVTTCRLRRVGWKASPV
jgi:hypothetical protein